MIEEKRPWYKRGWVIVGLSFTTITVFGLGLFVKQTWSYYQMLKRGETPDGFMPISRQINHSAASSLNRIERDRLKKMVAARPGDPFAGPEDAPHEMVFFMDYGCPYCKLMQPAIRDLMRLHPEIKITVRDYPVTQLHPDAKNAALAARCVWNQGNETVYWRYADVLYANQEQLDADSLETYARQAGANAAAYTSCLRSAAANAGVSRSVLDAESAGIKGTPTIFADGMKLEGVFEMNEILKYLNL